MSNPIYLALDLPRLDAAEALAQKIKGHVGGLKLGMEFFYAHGHHGVHEIAKIGLPLFLDLKLHDIPATVRGAASAVAGLRPTYLTVHASGGAEMIAAAADALPETRITAVTVLTSLDRGDLEQQRVGVKQAQLRGEQRARMGANGLDLSFGTPEAVLEQTDSEQDRSFAGAALTQCAVTAARWRVVLGAWPVTEAFPGGTE